MSNHPNIKEFDGFCHVLKLIANPNRLRIMVELLDGERSVGGIEERLSIKQPNLSHELKKLRDSGLVTTRRQSKVIFYAIADPDIAAFINSVTSLQQDLSRSTQASPYHAAAKTTGILGEAAVSAQRDPLRHTECGQFSIIRR